MAAGPVAAKFPQLVAGLEFGSVKLAGVKKDGSLVYLTLILVDDGSWIVDKDSSFGTTRLG